MSLHLPHPHPPSPFSCRLRAILYLDFQNGFGAVVSVLYAAFHAESAVCLLEPIQWASRSEPRSARPSRLQSSGIQWCQIVRRILNTFFYMRGVLVIGVNTTRRRPGVEKSFLRDHGDVNHLTPSYKMVKTIFVRYGGAPQTPATPIPVISLAQTIKEERFCDDHSANSLGQTIFPHRLFYGWNDIVWPRVIGIRKK
jgi:hypothetical protein